MIRTLITYFATMVATGAVFPITGYAVSHIDGRFRLSARAAWAMVIGASLTAGAIVAAVPVLIGSIA